VEAELGPDELAKLKILVEEVLEQESLVLSLEGYGGAVNEVAANETAFVHRTSYYKVGASVALINPNATEIAAATSTVQKFFDVGVTIFHHTASYQNYVSIDYPNFLQRYHGSNLARLQQVKRKYDPENYFHLEHSIPPN